MPAHQSLLMVSRKRFCRILNAFTKVPIVEGFNELTLPSNWRVLGSHHSSLSLLLPCNTRAMARPA